MFSTVIPNELPKRHVPAVKSPKINLESIHKPFGSSSSDKQGGEQNGFLLQVNESSPPAPPLSSSFCPVCLFVCRRSMLVGNLWVHPSGGWPCRGGQAGRTLIRRKENLQPYGTICCSLFLHSLCRRGNGSQQSLLCLRFSASLSWFWKGKKICPWQ